MSKAAKVLGVVVAGAGAIAISVGATPVALLGGSAAVLLGGSIFTADSLSSASRVESKERVAGEQELPAAPTEDDEIERLKVELERVERLRSAEVGRLSSELARVRAIAATRTAEREAAEKAKLERKRRVESAFSFSNLATDASRAEVGRVIGDLRRLGANLDVVFCIDATGSMGAHIAGVKGCICHVATMVASDSGMTARFALVAYRDYCDGALRHEVADFGTAAALKERLASVAATGGGDAPEDCFGGLKAALERVTWRAPARVVLWIGDSPQHGTRYATGPDAHPGGDPDGVTSAYLFAACERLDVKIVFCKLTDDTDQMMAALRDEARAFRPNLLLEYVVGGELSKFLASTLSTTSAMTHVGGSGLLGAEKPHTLVPYPWPAKLQKSPLLRDQEPVDVSSFKAYDGGDLHPLLDLVLDGPDVATSKAQVVMTAAPCDRGEFRLTYRAHVWREHPKWGERWGRGVLKESRYRGPLDSREAMLRQCHVQAAAIFLAGQFSASLVARGIRKHVRYVSVELVRFERGAGEGAKYMALEPFIDGEYIKFNNNCGFVNLALLPRHEVLQAFSHFTYAYSRGLTMVTDLQGCVARDGYVLTDPAIHTADPTKCLPDATNLGPEGMAAFFASHICGATCKRLGLPSPTTAAGRAHAALPPAVPVEVTENACWRLDTRAAE